MTSRRMTAAAALAAAAVVLAGGCGSSKPNPGLNQAAPTTGTPTPSASTPTPSISSTPPSTDPTAEADAAALTAYNGMVKSLVRIMNTNDLGNDMLDYAQGAAYKQLVTTLKDDQDGKIIFTGQPVSAPKVTATNLSANPPTVTITDCFGGPNWKMVFSADIGGYKKGQSAGTSLPPHPVTVTVQKPDTRWVVTIYTPAKMGTTC